jgi:hypothetical protein
MNTKYRYLIGASALPHVAILPATGVTYRASGLLEFVVAY